MAAVRNRVGARRRIEEARLRDAVSVARKLNLLGKTELPSSWPSLPDARGIDKAGLKRLLENELADPHHPAHWHKRAVAEALKQPTVRSIYFAIRRNLWNWREFLTLTEKARIILEIVIELAREDGWNGRGLTSDKR